MWAAVDSAGGAQECRAEPLMQKLKLYNGKTSAGFHGREHCKELREEAINEGLHRHLAALRAGQDFKRAGGACRMPVQHQPLHGH